jgi:glyoxylase-like metal-dependent hydrolase (beta-lactamase superfamily II)
MQTAGNTFLVHTGNRLVLVDVGAAGVLRPTLGSLRENIRAAGYNPADVGTVLLTHLRPGYVAGC